MWVQSACEPRARAKERERERGASILLFLVLLPIHTKKEGGWVGDVANEEAVRTIIPPHHMLQACIFGDARAHCMEY